MALSDIDAPRPGLRERKKERTRETIARVALEMFAERGYDETTLEEVAAAADVSKRTIFSYYSTKEDILFANDPKILTEVERRLRDKPRGLSTADALDDLLTSFTPDPQALVRKRIIGNQQILRRSERGRFARMEEVLAASIARDLDTGLDDLRPRLIAAAVTAAFDVAYDRILTHAAVADFDPCGLEAASHFADLIALLRAGVDALRR